MKEIICKSQSIEALKIQVGIFLKTNKISLKDFCQKFGIEKYYLEKVMGGLIRPSEYFIQKVLEKCK